VSRRDLPSRDHAITRRIRRARFERALTSNGFDFAAAPKQPAAQIRDQAGLRWLQAGESVIFCGLGPRPGRLRHARPHPAQADNLYEPINERAGRSPILTSNRSPVNAHLSARTCAR
jgi:hypothetical protein